jgi:7-cyano-7-deazaguanine synthase
MTSIVLLSGGLDSAVLLAHEAQQATVQPVYVSVGLAWEPAEQAMIEALLAAPSLSGRTSPLVRLEFGMRDIYSSTHWAVRGTPPAYDTPDRDVYLPGRNIVLLTKAAILGASLDASRMSLGILAGNPFPDATPEFFDTQARALSLGLDQRIEIATPFAALHKADVIKLGERLRVPLEYTLSCVNPRFGADSNAATTGARVAGLPMHCGVCSKCRERRDAFAEAGVIDRTFYASPSPRAVT